MSGLASCTQGENLDNSNQLGILAAKLYTPS